MEQVEREAKQLISASLNDSRVTVLRTNQVSAAETKRKYLKDGGKVHQHFNMCVKCEHLYVDLPPSNDCLHSKYMLQLKGLRRLKEAFELYKKYPHTNQQPVDSWGNVVKKIPRKSHGYQPIL